MAFKAPIGSTAVQQLNKSFLMEACRPRPDWEQTKRETREAIATYFQGDALKYLIPQYPKEELEKFLWRREYAMDNFDNYTKEISGALVDGCFRTKQPVRQTGDKVLDEYLAGDYDTWFRKEFAPFTLILPEFYVKLDVPAMSTEVLSAADQQEAPLPYPSTLFPYHAVNYEIDALGQLKWIVFALNGFAQQSPDGATEGRDYVPVTSQATNFEIYTADYYVAFNNNGEYIINPNMPNGVAYPIPHEMGSIPVVRCAYRNNMSGRDMTRYGHAMLHNTVKGAMGGLKTKAALGEYIYYSLHPKLMLDLAQAANMIEQGAGANKPVIVNPTGASSGEVFVPDFLRVPVEEIITLERICYERIPSSIYRDAGMRDRSVVKKGVESGASKAYDVIPETAKLKDVSMFLHALDLAIVRKMAIIRGLNPANATVEYPSSFDTKSVAELMTEIADFAGAMQSNGLPLPPQAKAIMAQRAIRAVLPDLTEQDYENMEIYINAQLAVTDGPESEQENFGEKPSDEITNEAGPSTTVLPIPAPAAPVALAA